MTDISRDAVDALLQGVTEGPWQAVFDRQTWGWLEVDGPSFKIGAPTRATDLSLADEVQRKTDARFIAAARELVPALRAALDEAEARAADYYERWNDCQEKRQKAEAERDAAVKFLAEAVDDLKIKESLHTNERGRDCLAFLAAHLGAKP